MSASNAQATQKAFDPVGAWTPTETFRVDPRRSRRAPEKVPASIGVDEALDVLKERGRVAMRMSAREIASTVLSGLPLESATGVRASVVATSRLAIRSLGRDGEYFAALETKHHAAIREISGVGWVPIEVADAHYRAADRLDLAPGEQREIGRQVAVRLRDSYAGSIIRSLRAVGALSPYSLLSRLPSAWTRLIQGGGARVFELGPKEIRVELLRTSIAQYGYVREGWAGMLEGTLALVSRSVHVVELPEHRGSDRCAYLISWV